MHPIVSANRLVRSATIGLADFAVGVSITKVEAHTFVQVPELVQSRQKQ